jgi:ribose/xylose/arabinose/galactoside ABC-type transport system permease subunit
VSRILGRLPAETGVGVVLALSVIWLSANLPNFRTQANAWAILSSASEIAIVAAGMTLVIATGGIDISVGSIIGLSGVAIGILAAEKGWSVEAACLGGITVGTLCGLVNGILIARFSVPPIIATLAMFSAARAAAYVLSDGNSISGLPSSLTDIGYQDFLGLPRPVWIAALTLLACGILLKRTAFGRSLLAIGGNRETAYLSGIRVRRTEIAVYAVSGLLAGLAAIVVTARGATAVPDAGRFFELRAITAVVLGGTSVAGGSATMTGTALGILTIGVIANGVRGYGQTGIWEQLILGIALLAAVEVDRWRRKRASSA